VVEVTHIVVVVHPQLLSVVAEVVVERVLLTLRVVLVLIAVIPVLLLQGVLVLLETHLMPALEVLAVLGGRMVALAEVHPVAV
jgi:hypothetical protein